jgi:hypoxanthine-guanine phosphoribosyltransferase
MKNNIGNFKSIDVYRKVLSKTGYLSESTGGGEFQILKHIDKNYQDLKILFIEYISKRFQY